MQETRKVGSTCQSLRKRSGSVTVTTVT